LHIPSGGNAPPAAPGAAPPVIPAACQSLSNDIIALTSETDETKIPQEVSALQTDITGADAACANYIVQANQAIAATSQVRALSLPVTLGDGDVLKITISRGSVKWEFDYGTPTLNHWTVYYGFTYSPDILTHFRNYYANPNGNNTYTITAMNGQYNRNTFQNLSPSVLFTYRFFKKDNAICKFGLTGGFQYNTQTLGALAGPSIVIADNISINTGIGFLQKYRLKGQYTPGQIISDNLDFSQLHDQIWTFDMFFSIGFNIPSLFTKNTSTNSSPTTTATKGN
jgi:hypothetical protein